MGRRYGDAFRTEAVRLALTSGLTRKQLAADLGIGFSTLTKWVQQDRHNDLMSGPHEDQAKELSRLRKENRILREEREILEKATVFFASQKRSVSSSLTLGGRPFQ
jgi:transposase